MSDSQQESKQQIKDLVREAQEAQFDVARFLELHTPDANVVNIRGFRVQGRKALGEAMSKALASSLRHVPTTVDVEDIRLVHPDVAIVSCTKYVEDERPPEGRGEDLPTAGRLTYVVTRHDGRWLITSAQTTPISG
jgi:uncharacterized protein (TIGR02246 family)